MSRLAQSAILSALCLVLVCQTACALELVGVSEILEMPDGRVLGISSIGVVRDNDDESTVADGLLREVWREIKTLLPGANESHRRRRGINQLGSNWGGWPNGEFPMRYNPANEPTSADKAQAQRALSTWSTSGADLDCTLGANTNQCPSLASQCSGNMDGENTIGV